jgi:ERCC4-type nuclease
MDRPKQRRQDGEESKKETASSETKRTNWLGIPERRDDGRCRAWEECVPPTKSVLIVRQNQHTIHVPKPTVIVDARKQAPYDFLRFENWIGGTEHKALEIGDYTIEGLEQFIVVEQKSLQEMVLSLSANREVFLKRCALMSKVPHKLIVVEACLPELKTEYKFPAPAHPNGMMGSLDAIYARWGIWYCLASNRYLAEERVASFLSKIYTLEWLQANNYGRWFLDGDI